MSDGKKTFRQLSDEDRTRFVDELLVVANRIEESFQRRVKPIAPWFKWDDYSWARLEAKVMIKTGHTPESLQSLSMQELTGVVDELIESMMSRPIQKQLLRDKLDIQETTLKKMIKNRELGLVNVPGTHMVRMLQSEFEKLFG